MNGYVVFYDHDKKKPADLIKAGGKYAELHKALTDQVKRSDELVAKWKKEHGSKAKVKL